MTCDEELGNDATDLFNILTGYSQQADFRQMLVAPLNLRRDLIERIDREIGHAREGRPAHLVFKANALVDRELIDKLYEASARRRGDRPAAARHLQPAAGGARA